MIKDSITAQGSKVEPKPNCPYPTTGIPITPPLLEMGSMGRVLLVGKPDRLVVNHGNATGVKGNNHCT